MKIIAIWTMYCSLFTIISITTVSHGPNVLFFYFLHIQNHYKTCIFVTQETVEGTFSLKKILPPVKELNEYVRYSGSYTVPPCTAGVSWNLFMTPIPISRYQVDYILLSLAFLLTFSLTLFVFFNFYF